MIVPDRTKFDRATILKRLRATINAGESILGAGASNGLIAKSAEAGGADLLIAYSTGLSRHMGLPTSSNLGHSNEITLRMYAELDNVVDDTPIIGGAEAGDATYRRLGRLVSDFRSRGYDGLINFPTIGNWAERERLRNHVGMGYLSEVEMVKLAREQDYFTMVYVYKPDHAEMMGAAGADVVVAHVGWTAGGAVGNEGAMPVKEACERVDELLGIARAENPDVIGLAHGGPFSSPEDTAAIYENTTAVGFVGASSIERIPVEQAVKAAVADFKSYRLRPRES